MGPMYRWVGINHRLTAVSDGFRSHGSSALWVFSMPESYRPGAGIVANSFLLAFDIHPIGLAIITDSKNHVNYEDTTQFKGEAAHPNAIIVKPGNEPGAYGIGTELQKQISPYVKTRFATRKEVAKALKCSEDRVPVSFRPGTTWPR